MISHSKSTALCVGVDVDGDGGGVEEAGEDAEYSTLAEVELKKMFAGKVGARDLARPPTITDIYHSAMEKAKNREEEAEEGKEEEEESEEGKRVLNRKFDAQQGDDLKKSEKSPKEEGKFKKAKNLAISMATKATSLSRELKSIKSDFCFMQERCALLGSFWLAFDNPCLNVAQLK